MSANTKRGLRVPNPNSRGHATKCGLRVPNPNSRGHATKRGLRVPNPNSRGHATKCGLRVPNPNSRGHATKRGLRVPNPNSRGHATKCGLRVPNPNSRGHATKRGLRVPNPNSRGHATKCGLRVPNPNSRGPKEGGNATSPLHSWGSPTKGNKIRSGYLTPAFFGAQNRAEMLRHPCILGGPQRQARRSKSSKLIHGQFHFGDGPQRHHLWGEEAQKGKNSNKN